MNITDATTACSSFIPFLPLRSATTISLVILHPKKTHKKIPYSGYLC
jgi:hypothetical protein